MTEKTHIKAALYMAGEKSFWDSLLMKSRKGFSRRLASAGHDKYHAKHAKEMEITVKQWVREAANILNSQKHELFLDWYNRDEKKFYRYEKATGRLAIGTKSGLISTFFILQKKHRKIYLPKEYLEIL